MIPDPCACKRFTPGQPWQRGQCAVCWHWHHTPAFREGHGERKTSVAAKPEREPAVSKARPKCQHLGNATGKKMLCRTCSGRVELKLFECAVHGQCTLGKASGGVAGCKGCPDYSLPVLSVDEWENLFRSSSLTAHGSHYHPNQTAAVHRIVDDLRAALPAVPSFQHTRGIVTSGGGAYWPGTWVTASILRELGWRHPIQAWFLGERERDAAWIGRLQALGVECVDAESVRKKHPYRVLNGFEVKLYAVMHSGIREPLWLDSDCYPCRDPNVLYECPGYAKTGAVWYPDMANADPWTKWDRWGVAADDSPPIETGQYLLDLHRVWEEASIALKLNELSDVTYHWDYGDKGPARVAWAWTRRDRTIYQRVPQWSGPAFVHPGPNGKPLFIHRCRGKVAPGKAKFYTPQNVNGQLEHKTLPGEALYQHYARRAAALSSSNV